MKKYLIILSIIFTTASVAQQLPIFNLYHVNPHLYNPAETGNKISPTIFTGYRNQWTGFEGAPKTSFINGSVEISDQLNLGLKIINDKVNVLNTTRVHFSYAYKLVLGHRTFLKMGFEPGVHFHRLDLGGVKATDMSDNLLSENSQSQSNFDVSFGLHYSNQGLNISVALPYLMSTQTRFQNLDGSENKFRQAKYSIGYVSYLISPRGSLWAVEPLVNYRYSQPFFLQFGMDLKVHYDDKYFVSLGYRKDASFIVSGGVSLDNNFLVAYSYSQSNRSISTVSNGSHELMLGYTFRDKSNKHMPRFQYDTYHDKHHKAPKREFIDLDDENLQYHAPKAILFDYNSDEISDDFYDKLKVLAHYMRLYPEKVLRLHPIYNNVENENGQELSITRMHKVVEFLRSEGVLENQLHEAHYPVHTHYGMGRIRVYLKH